MAMPPMMPPQSPMETAQPPAQMAQAPMNPAQMPAALQGIIGNMIQGGATQFNPPSVMSGPAGQTNFALSMGAPQPDDGSGVEYADAIDKEKITGLTDDKLQELGNLLFTKAWESRASRKEGGRQGNIELYRDMYEGIREERRNKPWPESSDLVTPDSRVQVETVAARITSSIFESPRLMKIKPGYPEDSEACLKCADFAKSELTAPGGTDLQGKFYRASQDALVDGYKVGFWQWKRRTKKIRQRVLINDQVIAQMGGTPPAEKVPMAPVFINGKKYRYMQWAILEQEKVTSNYFDITFINAEDVIMWPPTARDEESATVFGFQFEQSPEEMLELARLGYYDKDAVDYVLEHSNPIMTSDAETVVDESIEAKNRDKVGRHYEQGDFKHGRRKLMYVHARVHDADGDGEAEDICFCFEWWTKKFLRIALPDFTERPFKKLSFFPRVGGSYFDYSLIEKLYDTQRELDAVTRQGLDATTLAMSVIVQQAPVRRKLGDTPFRTGVTMRDKGVGGEIQKDDVITFPNVPNSSMVDRAEVRKMTEKISGADEVTQGLADNNSNTLGQTNLAVAGGNIRLKMALTQCLPFMTWLYRNFFEACMFYLEDGKSYEVIRNGNPTYPSMDLATLAVTQRAEVVAYTQVLDPEASLRAQKVQLMFQALANSPFLQNQYTRQWHLLNFFVRSLGIDDDLSQFIGTEQDAQQMDEAYLQTMQQQQAMAQMGGGVPGQPGAPGGQSPNGTPVPGQPPIQKGGPIGPQGMGPSQLPLNGGRPQ